MSQQSVAYEVEKTYNWWSNEEQSHKEDHEAGERRRKQRSEEVRTVE